MSDRSFSKLSKRRIVLFVFLLLIAVLSLGGVLLVAGERPPLPDALEALSSDDTVTVVLQPWLTFAPTENTPTTGFIFYPGGRIDPRGYAPLAPVPTQTNFKTAKRRFQADYRCRLRQPAPLADEVR